MQQQAHELAVSCADIAARADEADSLDVDVRKRLQASGLARVVVPAEYGGRDEKIDSLAVTLVREQLAAESSHLDSMFAMQGIGSYGLAVGGSPSLRAEWLPKVASLDAIAALGLTEPHVGSDLKALTTTVVERGDKLIVNGHKSFITNGGDADFYAILGREGEGYSLVLVPGDAPGLTTERPHQIIAPHVLSDVLLDDVEVAARQPHRCRWRRVQPRARPLATFRVSVAGAAVGMAEAALAEAVAARQRPGTVRQAAREARVRARTPRHVLDRDSRWRARSSTVPRRRRRAIPAPTRISRRWRRSAPPRRRRV